VEIERPTLVSTQTEDGLTLDGLYTASDPGTTAILAVHGLTMNAFDPLFLAWASTFCSRAYAFLSANTRGHDLGVAFRTPHGEVLGGSWWERFEDCSVDLEAWTRFLIERGHHRVVWLGLSFGALKVVHSAARIKIAPPAPDRPDANLRAVVVASGPVRASGRRNAAHRLDPNRVALAEEMVANGRGLDLLPWELDAAGDPETLSAQTFASWARGDLDVFGIERNDAPIARIQAPVLLYYGTAEPNVGTPEDAERIARNATSSPRADVRIIQGAGHLYAGHEHKAAAVIADWLDEVRA